MPDIIGSPSRYVQGAGIVRELGKYAAGYAPKALVIVGPRVHAQLAGELEKSFADAGCAYEEAVFNGECSHTEIDRLKEIVSVQGCGVVVGAGGGKVLDTAKAVAHYSKLPVIIMPTAASSDAPCSALSVIYTDDHVFEEYLYLKANPDMVVVDTEVISQAPPRLLASGMGDALATYFEARACKASHALNCLGGNVTSTAMAIAKLCYDTLIENGIKAILAANVGAVTPAFEKIVEANTYMSGVGFESGGLAAAHAIHNGLTALPATHEYLHGEKVAFGLIAMLVMEDSPDEEIQQVIDFCVTMGLPVTFAQLGIPSPSKEDLMKVATLAAAEGETSHNMPFPVTPTIIYNALLGANAMGAYTSGEDDEEEGGCCHHHE